MAGARTFATRIRVCVRPWLGGLACSALKMGSRLLVSRSGHRSESICEDSHTRGRRDGAQGRPGCLPDPGFFLQGGDRLAGLILTNNKFIKEGLQYDLHCES